VVYFNSIFILNSLNKLIFFLVNLMDIEVRAMQARPAAKNQFDRLPSEVTDFLKMNFILVLKFLLKKKFI